MIWGNQSGLFSGYEGRKWSVLLYGTANEFHDYHECQK